MRQINLIVIHCSATTRGRDIGCAELRRCHKARGFCDVGYHFIIRLDGTVESGRPLAVTGAHVKGHNSHSIGICYVGGLDTDGKTPRDTRTPQQRSALRQLVSELKNRFPGARVAGHRDLSPDRNHDGRITPDEWLKACPCFDVATDL